MQSFNLQTAESEPFCPNISNTEALLKFSKQQNKVDSITDSSEHLFCICTLQLSNSPQDLNSTSVVIATVRVRVAKPGVKRRKYIYGIKEKIIYAMLKGLFTKH